VAGAFDAKVDISTKEARDGLIALRKEVKSTAEMLSQLDTALKGTAKDLKTTADALVKIVGAQRAATAGTKELAQADIAAARAAGIRNTAEAKKAELLARRANQEAQAGRATAQAGLATARTAESTNRASIATDRHAQATQRAAQSQNQMHDSLSNSRYLMYDVGTTYGVLSAALLTIPAATAAVAAAYQKDFAQVVRVNEDFQQNTEAAQVMKGALKDLGTEIPTAFGDLTRTTQLGAQMGVNNDKLAAFTETTAKFVAVTGISADTGATLFGRMETSFTADVEKYPDFFERLGSSIAYVGAKTVATDPEIAAMLNQIGPLGAAAGMSADQVTGLSAALASVRVRPELARGALTKIFGNINRDVAEGSPRLEKYGALMGMTGDQAAKLWKTDSSKFFTNMIAGLNTTLQKNGELTTTLDDLGIKELRVSDALTKLAVGNDVLVKSMDYANQGFKEGTALNKMAAPVFETLAAKLTEMANAWKNLGDTLGSGALVPMAMFVETAKNVAIWLRSISENADGSITPIGHLLQILMGIATVTALFLGFKAAQAFVMAGMIGFQQAAARGMGGGLALGNQVRTLAQTMLMAKGATESQSRALLGQVGAMRALMVASSTSSQRIASMATVTNNVNYATGRATAGWRAMGSSMLGLVGGPIGLVIGALALLTGSLLNTQMEAEQAGKAIAEAMAQGADTGARAVAEAFNNRKVGLTDGALGFSDIGKTVTQIAERAGVGFQTVVESISKGEKGLDAFKAKLEEIAKADGYKNLADALSNPLPGTKAADLQFLNRVVEDYSAKNKDAAKGLKAVSEAAPLAGKGLKDLGEDGEEGAAKIDDITKALKELNDEIFGIINSEAAVQSALQNLGESLYKSKSFSVNNESGRENLKNFEDAAAASREHFFTMMKQGTATAEQAAQGYAEFIQGLINEIKVQGGDTSGIETLAMQSAERFQQALGAHPAVAKIEVSEETVLQDAQVARNGIQGWLDANGEIHYNLGVSTTDLDTKLDVLTNDLVKITGMPYEVVMDALTNPASEKAQEIDALLLAITNDTYTAAVDADTTAAVTNVQNFVNYARTELAHLQTKMNGGIGYGDGEGSMNPTEWAKFGAITAPKPVTRQVRKKVEPISVPKVPVSSLQGLGDGFRKAGDEAAKAGKKTKQAAKDIEDGIDDAVQAAEDYGNRLKQALMSAYNQQYALTTATDEYHSALNAITKKREDEIKKVEELRDKVRELNDERDKELISANKAKIEQKISIKYGETDRAADYGQQAKEALDNAAAKQKEIDASNKEANTVQAGIGLLTGYSDAAIANRAALRDLETKMIDMVAAYAATGHSQQEVKAYAQQLTAQFQTDVGQIGFNIDAVGALQGSMERYIGVVDSVPQVKPTKIEADTDQATQDVTAFNDLLDGIPDEIPVTIKATVDTYKGNGEAWSDVVMGDGSIERVNRGQSGDFQPGFYNTGGEIKGYASGGGVIPGTPPANPTKDNLLAQVDGKGLVKVRSHEFIQPEGAVNYYGLDFMEAIRTMKLPKFAMGGSPSGARGSAGAIQDSVVELGAATLAAMAEMRQDIKLFTENRVIAEAANAGNKQLAAEGHR